ncbi:MAG: Rab family GTPase [Anaerolineales bacterium]
MLGDFAVGKTSLVRRFVEGRFDDRYLSTIGVKISRRTVTPNAQTTVHLLVWDLAGSEEFTGAQASYLQGAAGALLVCDLTRASTLPSVARYAARLREVNPFVSVLLLANKADLVDQHEIFEAQLTEMVGSIQAAGVFLTSAKDGRNVETAFLQLTHSILK